MYTIFRGGNIGDGEYFYKGDDLLISKQFVKDNTILKKNCYITPSVTSIEHIGKIALIDTDLNKTVAGGFVLIVYPMLENDDLQKYYLYVLSSKYHKDNCKKITNKSGQAFYNLSREKLMQLILPLPPIEEQKKKKKKIKQFLPYIDNYNSIYNKIEILNSNYKDELKKSILQHAIQGKLVNQDSNDEPAEALINKILDEKRELIKRKQIKKENLSVIYKDSTDNQFYEKFDDGTISNITDEIPFEIPNNWCWTRLRNITSIKGGKRLPVGSKFSNATTNHIYIRVTDMQNQTILDNDIQYISDNIYEKIKKYTISQDDLYIVIVGSTIGKVGKVPSKFNNMNLTENAAKLVFNKMDKDYLLVILQSDFVQNQLVDKTKQVGVPKLALTRLGNTLICYPPLEEQRRIVNKLNQISNYIKTAE